MIHSGEKMTKKEQEILLNCELFKNSGCNISKEVFTFETGEMLSSPDTKRKLGVVLFGKAKAVAEDGQTILNIFEKGDVFKAAGLFAEDETCTCVIAQSKTRAVFFEREEISLLIAENPVISQNYIRFLSDRIGFLNRKISYFSLGSTEARLARFLYCRNEEEINVSSAKLCLMLSVARASLYRAFLSLEKQGAIVHDRGIIKILNKDILKRIYKGE